MLKKFPLLNMWTGETLPLDAQAKFQTYDIDEVSGEIK